jgi:2-desacetyl-2-hydroxyethyl bacteriochlorophyllide A dehydrogenase
MRAVLLPGDKEVQVTDMPDPQPGTGDVLIQMKVSAICRSDMSLYYGNPIVGGDSAGTGRIIPGHEPCGQVVAVGPDVGNVAVGDRVAVYLAIGCGHCRYCLGGYRMLCPSWTCVGFDINGGDAEYIVVPAINCLRLPDEMSYEAGALSTDLVGTLYHAEKRLNVSGADTVVVYGLGPMGAAGVMVAKARGARVIAVDVLDARLELARGVGADETVNSKNDDPVASIIALTDGIGADVAIDCSGNPVAENAALNCAAKFGRVAFVGESRETTINPSNQLIRKLLTVIGAWYFPLNEYDEIARFIVRHTLPLERLVTHRFSIEQAPDAFRMFDQRETEKAVFVF